jgi:ParB/RepB/Spo0J family partition protein
MKKNEETVTSVPVGKIVSESNRKHGGMGNIEILAESIKTEGLISPPTVAAIGDGTYRIVAGRRRIEAVRQLKWKEVLVRVISEADAGRLESIALAENVNRQEMHPLDEAETFKKLLDKGTAVEDIAAYYDRSVAGIQHRVRLMGLTDEVREMFREGKIPLSGAALIASLPPEDQAKFHKKFGEKGAGKWDISCFLHSSQRFTLDYVAGKECEECKKRTHNSAPGLFDDEYTFLHDSCFDTECYAKHWKNLIQRSITKSGNAANTEHKIILGRDVPKFVPGKTASLDMEGEEYTLLAPDKHTWSDTNKKSKANTAWAVSVGMKHKVEVQRVSYKKYERPAHGRYNTPSDPVKDYMIDQIPDISEEYRKAAAEKVREKYRNNRWAFRNEVKERLLDAVITKRMGEGSGENLAALYLTRHCYREDEEGNWREIGNEELFTALFGPEAITGYKDIPREPLIQKLFLFLIAEGLDASYIPDIDDFKPDWDGEWNNLDTDLFWKFAGLTKEEYISMYRGFLAEAAHAAIKGMKEDEE